MTVENSLLLILVVGLAILFIGIRSSRHPRKKNCQVEPHTSSVVEDENVRNLQARKTPPKAEAMRPFDSKTAHRPPFDSVILGRARVIDGDTISINKTQIRLFGIDAPEINHPFGRDAKWALISLCKGQIIRAEISEMDAHGRVVAKCNLPDGRDLSAEMVKRGLAIDWPKFSGGVYRSLETPDARRRMWLADARQKGRMHVWDQYEAKQLARKSIQP